MPMSFGFCCPTPYTEWWYIGAFANWWGLNTLCIVPRATSQRIMKASPCLVEGLTLWIMALELLSLKYRPFPNMYPVEGASAGGSLRPSLITDAKLHCFSPCQSKNLLFRHFSKGLNRSFSLAFSIESTFIISLSNECYSAWVFLNANSIIFPIGLPASRGFKVADNIW